MLVFHVKKFLTNGQSYGVKNCRSTLVVSRTFNWLEIGIVKQGGILAVWRIKCFNETSCIGHDQPCLFDVILPWWPLESTFRIGSQQWERISRWRQHTKWHS